MSDDSLTLPNNLTIRTISDLQTVLRSKIDESERLSLDISEDAETDLSTLQILEAANLYASSAGKSLGLLRPAEGSIRATLDRVGWLTNASTQQKQFWLHEGDI